jgi:hypothetical protein
VECDARQPIATVAEPLSSVAAGNLFRSESGHGAGARFLEPVLEGEETVFKVSAMDARDEGSFCIRRIIVAARYRLMQFDLIDIQFDYAVSPISFYFYLTTEEYKVSVALVMIKA